jgi:glycosyltransferase involved in cell wall biosynthesis
MEVEARKENGEQPQSEFNVFVRRNEARLVPTNEVSLGSPTSAPRRLALAAALARRSSEYDTLVASGEDIGLPLALALLACRVSKPVWIIIHGSYLGTGKFSAIAPLLRRAGQVNFLCLSESLRRQLIERHAFPEGRCFNAGYGVDTAFFAAGDNEAAPLIVSAGSSNRDYRTLVAAVSGLDVPVRIAADSLWRPKDAEIDHDGLPPSVQVGSAGDYVGLRALYARASIVVVPLHPARYACGYAVIAEAMAMGKVVVTTRTEAPSDFVIEGETGLYTDPGDVEGLRTTLRGLLQDVGRARAMGAAAAARMRNFSLDAYCQRIETLIGMS